MSATHLLLATLVLASSIFLMRLAPLALIQRRLRRHQQGASAPRTPPWIEALGPLLIAALLGVSLVPSQPGPAAWAAVATGVIATAALWRLTQGLGLAIIAGVAGFALVLWLAGA